ncbi:hypothetical protein DENSPDRAFT_115727 [Dentipellis sp. KUC8613]|nr:hypothetical protein DENSPDRAFT_115727 [Dentipellis sp. KUC8613]
MVPFSCVDEREETGACSMAGWTLAGCQTLDADHGASRELVSISHGENEKAACDTRRQLLLMQKIL